MEYRKAVDITATVSQFKSKELNRTGNTLRGRYIHSYVAVSCVPQFLWECL